MHFVPIFLALTIIINLNELDLDISELEFIFFTHIERLFCKLAWHDRIKSWGNEKWDGASVKGLKTVGDGVNDISIGIQKR